MTKKIEFTDRAKEQIEKIINGDQLKKFFRISFSPFSLLFAYSESTASLIPKADKCMKCLRLYSLQSFASIEGNIE